MSLARLLRGASVFDKIGKEDLIIAFFPCIYFSCLSQMSMTFSCTNYINMSAIEKGSVIIRRSKHREEYFAQAVKMFAICLERGIPLIMENPWSQQTFLKQNFVMPPAYIDNDRSKRGDYFKKPTAYWFLNCEPCKKYTLQPRTPIKVLSVNPTSAAGVCNSERSKISPDYAYNFICDQILGCNNKNERQLSLPF